MLPEPEACEPFAFEAGRLLDGSGQRPPRQVPRKQGWHLLGHERDEAGKLAATSQGRVAEKRDVDAPNHG